MDGILNENNYDVWKKDRSILEGQAALQKLKEYVPTMVQNCLDFIKHLDEAAKSQKLIDLDFYLNEMSMKNLLSTIIKNPNIDYKDLSNALHQGVRQVFLRRFGFTYLPWILPTENKRIWENALKSIRKAVDKIIKDHLQDPKENDLVEAYVKGYSNESNRNYASEQMHKCIMTILLAGHETVASTLLWVFVMLSMHPDVERRLSDEIETVLKGKQVTYDDLKQLPYVKAVLSETLRMYPVVPFLQSRLALKDDEIQGYRIPKGTGIIISAYHVHHHPDFWENPEGFDPERFFKNPWFQHQLFAFMPGSAGERQCPGIHFGMQEAYITIVTVLQHKLRLYFRPGSIFKYKKDSLSLNPNNSKMLVAKKT